MIDSTNKDKSVMSEFNKYEEAVQAMGQAIIDQMGVKWKTDQDAIATEIWNYKRKYGKKWFKRFSRDAYKLANAEHLKVKKC